MLKYELKRIDDGKVIATCEANSLEDACDNFRELVGIIDYDLFVKELV